MNPSPDLLLDVGVVRLLLRLLQHEGTWAAPVDLRQHLHRNHVIVHRTVQVHVPLNEHLQGHRKMIIYTIDGKK